ncbi:Ppx/GppA phosphatase family protein [Desulfocucumis palustris]|nr:Ppx/GppA phosphatase family protein [Desulfocucumis palustris]
MSTTVGIIDLGSNSIRLTLMQTGADGSYKLLDEIKETARIGENMGPERVIKPPAVERAVRTVRLLHRFSRANNVDTMFGVATAAVRSAVNGVQVLETIKNETGLSFRILSGREEARYAYLGVANTLDIKDGLVVDIGGGSTELILCRDRKMVCWASLPYGAVNLTENHLSAPGSGTGGLERLESCLCSAWRELSWLESARGLELLGVGGTMRSLGRIDRKQINYSLNILHGYFLPSGRVNAICGLLRDMPVEQRKHIPGLSKERADIILAGAAAVSALLAFTGSPGIRISGSGVREGVFFEHFHGGGPGPVVDDVAGQSVQNFMSLYRVRRQHALQVAKLSLSLFDQLVSIHGYGSWERRLLGFAALLHDTGNVVSNFAHNKHTLYILLNARLDGLSHRETVLVALIAACHGKIELKPLLQQYGDILEPGDDILVRRLGILVKMAENLDRSESGVVEELVCSIGEKEVLMKCKTRDDAGLEIRELYKNVTNFNKVYGKRFRFPKEDV